VEPTWTFADYIERDNRAVQTESKLPGLYECVFR
jgi:hypothetical protein